MARMGGPKKGAGRVPGPPKLRRSEGLRITFRQSELHDLEEIAEAWELPKATVAWAMVHSELQKCRRRAPNLGEAGLAIAAAARVLGRQIERADPAGSPSS